MSGHLPACHAKQNHPRRNAEMSWSTNGGTGLNFFNPTQAVHDLAAAMKQTDTGLKRFLYGVSYGTYFVQRFMSMYDTMLEGVILDGVVPAVEDENGFMAIDDYDNNFNEVALAIASECDKNKICSTRLKEFGPDTKSVLAKTFEKIAAGEICEPLRKRVTPKELRAESADLIKDFWRRELYPAMIYRLNRCAPKGCDSTGQPYRG